MTAADNLARWREAVDAGLTPVSHTEFRTFARRREEALPALLAFAEEVLAACDKADANPEDGLRKVHTATLRQAAEKHLGGVR